jgi:multidrug resistance efflux pump
MRLVQDIEAAMEECLDQDVEVVHPAAADATYVSRAAGELSKRHGPTMVLGLPLRCKGEPVSVLTVERPADESFAPEEIEALRLACDLCTSRLMNLYEHDRWFGARAAATMRKGFAALVGPKHTWGKLAAVLIFAALLFLILAKGDYRAEAPFVLEATEQQVVPAPFDGYLKSVFVEPPDIVEANKTVLAALDTAELRLQLASSRAELAGYLKEAAAAMRDGKTAEAQIAEAQGDKTRAEMRLLEHRISQANIVSPLGGCVVKGELKRKIGAPVKTGDVLFEVAPLESLRAVLSVPEDLIADVIEADRKARAGRRELGGELATAAHPEIRVPFVVERINPVAEVVNQRNVFKVRVKLLEAKDQVRMQPGMEGAAKINIEPRRYVWIWTRRLVNWLRMKLWL